VKILNAVWPLHPSPASQHTQAPGNAAINPMPKTISTAVTAAREKNRQGNTSPFFGWKVQNRLRAKC
jgi:hypothetical protein